MVITKSDNDPKPDPKDIVNLSDDNKTDCCDLSVDNDKPYIDKVRMKVVVNGRTSKKVKVEKDRSTLNMQIRARKEARQKEQEDKNKQLKEEQENIKVANERAALWDSKLNLLESNLEMLVSKLALPWQSWPIASPCFATLQPPQSSTSALVVQVVEHQLAETLNRPLDNKGDAVSLA